MYHYFPGIQTLFHQQQYEDVSLDHGQRLSRTTYTLQKTVGTGGDSGVDPCLPYFNNRVGRGRLCPPHYYSPLEFSDLPTALLATYYTAAQVNFHIRSFPEEQQFSVMTRALIEIIWSHWESK